MSMWSAVPGFCIMFTGLTCIAKLCKPLAKLFLRISFRDALSRECLGISYGQFCRALSYVGMSNTEEDTCWIFQLFPLLHAPHLSTVCTVYCFVYQLPPQLLS